MKWIGMLCLVLGAVVPVQATEQGPLIVAHRGASHDRPENTVAAFEEAWEQGSDAIEGDFFLTRDGKIVCFHDRTTKRIAGVDRRVEDQTLEELQALDVGAWKGEPYAGMRMPVLADVLALVPEGKQVFLDIKSGPQIVQPMRAVIDQSDLTPDQIVVIAFNAEVVAETRRRIPEVQTYWLLSHRQDEQTGEWTPSLDDVLATLRRIDAHGLSMRANAEVATEAFVAALSEADFEFHTWTVNDPPTAIRFAELGVDSITTDRPAFIRNALIEAGLSPAPVDRDLLVPQD